MTARIDRLWPDPAEQLSDDDLVAPLERDGVRVNFVTSLDGAATRDGVSGALGGAADERYFELLRRVADVVVVGVGTVRAEGYGALRVSGASAAWREAHGRAPHPVLAIVSGSLGLDPASPVFTDAPTRPVVLTSERASGRTRFEGVADVVVAGGSSVDGARAVAALRERGLHRILCEGGPTWFGTLLAADAMDELCLTVAPTLEAGDARRIATGATPPRGMTLTSVHRSGSELLLRYQR